MRIRAPRHIKSLERDRERERGWGEGMGNRVRLTAADPVEKANRNFFISSFSFFFVYFFM